MATTYDPNKPPWQQNYAAPGVQPQNAPAGPTANPQVAPWRQNYNAPADSTTTSTAQPATSTDPFIKDLQTNWPAQLAAGVTQGFLLDPIEKAGELTGLGQNPPKWLEDRLQATREAADKGYAGVGGHIAGQLADPLFWFLPELKAAQLGRPTAEFLGKAGEAAAKLLTGGYRGAVGGASEPTGAKTPAEARKQTVPQLLTGGAVGAGLGLPGAIAKGMNFDNVQQVARTILSSTPFEIRRLLHLRDLGIPNFTSWWHGHSLEPIRGRVPPGSSKEVMNTVGGKIGQALDDAKRNMTFDLTDPTVSRNLRTVVGDSRLDLGIGGGNTVDTYNNAVQDLFATPLSYTGGKLNPNQLQDLTSNLEAHIRKIVPDTPDKTSLKQHLEKFVETIHENASGTPAQKRAYAKAREAWRRHAIGRESQPLGQASGHIDPDDVAKELNRRYPGGYPYGGARGRQSPTQKAVNNAQEAMIKMSSAARRGARGRNLRQPEDIAAQSGAVSNDQPMRFSWPSQ